MKIQGTGFSYLLARPDASTAQDTEIVIPFEEWIIFLDLQIAVAESERRLFEDGSSAEV